MSRTPRPLSALLTAMLGLSAFTAGGTPVHGARVDADSAPVRPAHGAPDPATGAIPSEPAAERYFVVLADPPLAQYRGGIAGLAPTAVDARRAEAPEAGRDAHLDLDTNAARAYADHLRREQDRTIARLRLLAPELRVDWRYQITLNGFAAAMTPAHAMAAMRLPGVTLVYPEETLELELDSTHRVIHTTEAWTAAGGREEAGLGARIAVLDTGGAPAHPFFDDEGMPPPPEGFPSARLYGRGGQVLDYPDPTQFTNAKLIGARVFVRTATEAALGQITPLAFDNGDHGLHVAGIAAGRHGTYTIESGGQTVNLELSGVAPMAHVLHYVVNDNTPGMAAAFEQLVKDEADVVNISQGHVGWLLDRPDRHPIALAIAGAAEAGVATVVSAGNAGGNGRTSLSGSWKYSENLLAVGSTSPSGTLTLEMTVAGAGVPDAVKTLLVAPRGAAGITQTITAPIVLAPDGGCTAFPEAAGKIAVVERFDALQQPVGGTCGYEARAATMKQSGAIAVVYIYYNQRISVVSATPVALPAVSLGRIGGTELTAWLRSGGQGSATIGTAVTRGYAEVPDILAGSSSRGPGLGWEIKPDVSAPGDGIWSSCVLADDNGDPSYQFCNYGGTSMASPTVAGAVGLLRSIHPDWTVPQLRSAVINTSARTILVPDGQGGETAANVTQGGPGRLDMTHIADPGAFLFPPKASFGVLGGGDSREIEVAVQSASDRAETWALSVDAVGGDGEATVSPASVTLGPGERKAITVRFAAEGTADREHWGDVVLARGDSGQKLRLAYYAYVNRKADRRNVLIANWTYGNSENHLDAYTETLDQLGLTWSVWNMGDAADGLESPRTTHPTFEEMYRHDLVILNANTSQVGLQEALAGQYQYQNYVLSGGSLLIAGQGAQGWWRYLGNTRLADTPALRQAYADTWPFQWLGPSQNGGCEMCIARYFAGYTPGITATLSGRLLRFPQKPAMEATKVILEPHPDAEGAFPYILDISTGDKAPAGAAGNQYAFASGDVARGYVPTTGNLNSQLGDVGYAEGVLERTSGLARPLWSYPVGDKVMTVGTYIAGRQHRDADVPWNAMFWGFGLEGVGAGEPGSVSRARLLGDTFNFLAHNLYLESEVGRPSEAEVKLTLSVPAHARLPKIARYTLDWGDAGGAQPVAVDPPAAIDAVLAGLTLTHRYRGTGSYAVRLTLEPAAGEGAAPVVFETAVDVDLPTIFLPLVVNGFDLAGAPAPAAAVLPTRD